MTLKQGNNFLRSQSKTDISVIHQELHSDTHSCQLDIQVAQHTRHSNDSNIVATDVAVSITIFPNLSTGVVEGSLTGTTTATHNTIDTANSTNSRASMSIGVLLVRSSLGSRSRSTRVDSSAGTGRAGNSNLCRQEGPTRATDPGVLGVGAVHETILQQEGRTVSNERITLHLSDTDTTTLRTTLHGLTRERVDGTSRTHLELVVHHVTQTLVVDQAHVNVGGELAASDATVHRLVAVVVVTGFAELLTEVVGCGVFFGELEGS